jgi:hypothetical protein
MVAKPNESRHTSVVFLYQRTKIQDQDKYQISLTCVSPQFVIMTEFDHTSILRGLNSEDVDSLRRLMNAIMHRLAGVAPATAAQMSDLNIAEHAIMIWVTEAARDNPLLERMVTRFASARYGNSNTVREAARELDLVVIDAVLNPGVRPHRELVIAEGFFNQLVANGHAAYGAGVDNEYGDIEPESDSDRNDSNVRWTVPDSCLLLSSSTFQRGTFLNR